MEAAKTCITIASSDPTGGAGVQADLRAFAAAGCFGVAVIPMVTAQDGVRTVGYSILPDDLVCNQLACAIASHEISAIKLGCFAMPDAAVHELRRICLHREIPLVVDPVLVTAGGDRLYPPGQAVQVLETLRPAIRVLTPNGEEARLLATELHEGEHDRPRQAQLLGDWLGAVVVITGGDDAGGSDLVYDDGDHAEVRPTRPPLPVPFVHGAGCTHSALLTALLAYRWELPAALSAAQSMTSDAIHSGFSLRTGVRVPVITPESFRAGVE